MKVNEKKAGVILSYITIALSAVINFAYVPILLKYLKGDYGVYDTIGSLMVYFSIMDFGLGSTIMRFYSKYLAVKDEKNMANVLAICSRIYGVITGLILVIGTFIYLFFDKVFQKGWSADQIETGKKIFIVLLISIAVTIISQIFNAVISSHERFTFLKVATLIQTVLQPVVVVLVLMGHPTALAVSIVMAVSNILLVIVKAYYCYAKLDMKIKLYKFEKALVWGILGFSLYIFINTMADQMLWRSNQLIISALVNADAEAVYSNPVKIFNIYAMISGVVFSIFLPMVTTMVANNAPKEEFSKLHIKAGRLQFIVLFAILTGFILLGMTFFKLWLGGSEIVSHHISEMYWITIILLAPYTIELIESIGFVIIQARNKCKFRALLSLFMAVVAIAVEWLVTELTGGIVACSIVTGSTFVITSGIIMNVYFKRVMDLDVKSFWTEIVKIFIPGAICCVISGIVFNFVSLQNSLFDFLFKGVIYASLYIAFMWVFVMNEYEKNLIVEPIKKIKKVFAKKEEI